MYVFKSSSQYAGQYRSYTNGLGGGDPLIASSQGFFVRVSSGQTSGMLTFRNAQRLTSYAATSFRRDAADLRPQLQLSLAGTTAPADELVVYFEAGATPAADGEFDAVKLLNPSGLSLAALSATGQPLAIDGRPLLGAQPVVIPLSVGVPAAGAYVLTVAELRNFAAGTTLWLRDNVLGRHGSGPGHPPCVRAGRRGGPRPLCAGVPAGHGYCHGRPGAGGASAISPQSDSRPASPDAAGGRPAYHCGGSECLGSAGARVRLCPSYARPERPACRRVCRAGAAGRRAGDEARSTTVTQDAE